MTLDECIEYFEIEAETSDSLMVPYESRKKYSDDCKQMEEWLRELKAYKDARVGCEYCKHNYREQHERPCSLCQRNFMDMFEREVNADDNNNHS